MNANPSPEPSDQDVQKEAYLLYIASGCAPGHDLENWLTARTRLMNAQDTGRGKRVVLTAVQQLHFPLNTNVSRSPFGAAVHPGSHN